MDTTCPVYIGMEFTINIHKEDSINSHSNIYAHFIKILKDQN